jgi:16S rRNA (cytosine1407-C5)-methyltransferase
MLHPSFESELQREHPLHANKLLEVILESQAPVSVRINPFKWDEARHALPSETGSQVPWEPDARYLKSRPVFTLDPLMHAGGYYVQEASSMWIGEVMRGLMPALRSNVSAGKPLRVLDLCAAPGGKSTHLASVLSGEDFLVSNETHRSRARILHENITKWGNSNVAVTSGEAGAFASLGSWFDVVVVDAPCSGEGLFRRDPSARKEWSPEAVQQCSVRQNQILRDIWPALKPGGYLIYSTCTFNRTENDHQLLQILSTGEALPVAIETGNPQHGVITEQLNRYFGDSQKKYDNNSGSVMEAPSDIHPDIKSQTTIQHWVELDNKTNVPDADAPISSAADFTNTDAPAPNHNAADFANPAKIAPIYRCFPGLVQGEGFTFGVVQKTHTTSRLHASSTRKGRLQAVKSNQIPWLKALNPESDYMYQSDGSTQFAVESRFASLVRELDTAVYVLSAGVELGDDKKPAHALALSQQLKRGHFPEIELNREQALDYLRRETLRLEAGHKGWVILTWKGLPLGFGKAVQGRINNQYPPEWRIRNL